MRVPDGTWAPYNKWEECYKIEWVERAWIDEWYGHKVWWGGGSSCSL